MLLVEEWSEHSPKPLRIQRRSPTSPTSAARGLGVLSHPSSYSPVQSETWLLPDGPLWCWKSQPGKQHPTEMFQGFKRIFLKISAFCSATGDPGRKSKLQFKYSCNNNGLSEELQDNDKWRCMPSGRYKEIRIWSNLSTSMGGTHREEQAAMGTRWMCDQERHKEHQTQAQPRPGRGPLCLRESTDSCYLGKQHTSSATSRVQWWKQRLICHKNIITSLKNHSQAAKQRIYYIFLLGFVQIICK